MRECVCTLYAQPSHWGGYVTVSMRNKQPTPHPPPVGWLFAVSMAEVEATGSAAAARVLSRAEHALLKKCHG